MGGSISWRRGKLHEVVKINKGLSLEERVAFLELAVESLQMQKQQDERDEWARPDGGVPLPDNHPEAKQ